MPLKETDVDYVARLARLEISAEERALYTAQLDAILGHAADLSAVDTTGLEPTFHVLPLKNVVREDTILPSMPRAEILANAPDQAKGCFRVPKIIE
ncbi:MAG: Asp-tRNA(Asn)/Glu-tRNA(Gln) amidotransferase subunit GatC [candidate division FCPU426 bacterium]